MLPKHRQLQNSTLSIHTPVSMVSWRVDTGGGGAVPVSLVALAALGWRRICREGMGIMPGLMPRSSKDPTRPTMAERRKPGLERSMSHQSRGLARASVAEIWRVDDQASLR